MKTIDIVGVTFDMVTEREPGSILTAVKKNKILKSIHMDAERFVVNYMSCNVSRNVLPVSSNISVYETGSQ